MKVTIIGFILSFMAIFPLAEFGGGQSLKSWMEEYERFLIRQNEENFRREAEEVKNEQETSQKIQTEAPDTGSDHVDAPDQSIDGGNERVAESVEDDSGPGLPETGAPVATETTAAEEVPAPAEQVPLYAVNGAVLAEDLQAYLYRRFCEAGIGWFYEYALLIAYQESRFNVLAENPNGRDKGLFQYRIEYYPGLDWRNPYAEADVFIQQMANRAYAGKTVAEMISAHNQSDWGPYCQEYVSIVMSWEPTLQRIR